MALSRPRGAIELHGILARRTRRADDSVGSLLGHLQRQRRPDADQRRATLPHARLTEPDRAALNAMIVAQQTCARSTRRAGRPLRSGRCADSRSRNGRTSNLSSTPTLLHGIRGARTRGFSIRQPCFGPKVTFSSGVLEAQRAATSFGGLLVTRNALKKVPVSSNCVNADLVRRGWWRLRDGSEPGSLG
jgi:hypothetical protein